MIKSYSCHAIKNVSYFWILKALVFDIFLFDYGLNFIDVDSLTEDMISFEAITFQHKSLMMKQQQNYDFLGQILFI